MTSSIEHKSGNKHGHPKSKERLKKCVFKKFITNNWYPALKRAIRVIKNGPLQISAYFYIKTTTNNWRMI